MKNRQTIKLNTALTLNELHSLLAEAWEEGIASVLTLQRLAFGEYLVFSVVPFFHVLIRTKKQAVILDAYWVADDSGAWYPHILPRGVKRHRIYPAVAALAEAEGRARKHAGERLLLTLTNELHGVLSSRGHC